MIPSLKGSKGLSKVERTQIEGVHFKISSKSNNDVCKDHVIKFIVIWIYLDQH
jgi:hypothetical protein